jgi:hypothetical protein
MEHPNFNNQTLTLESNGFRIELKYESQLPEDRQVVGGKYNEIIAINDSEASNLEIRIVREGKEIKNGLITGINGGTWLYKATPKENSQSAKFKNNNLILSLGFNLVSIEIPSLKLNWNIEPDPAEIFEFYDLGDDLLLRGELNIHRIDSNGNIKWSYGGRDIWVNIDGKREVTVLDTEIKLIDFDSNEYVVNFEGKTITNFKQMKHKLRRLLTECLFKND